MHKTKHPVDVPFRIVNVGIDTVKVNVKLLDENGQAAKRQELPESFIALLRAWQETAQIDNKPLKTSMTFDDVRMMMLPHGSPTWRYILKNDCINVAIAPRLNVPMVAKVTFSSSYLWKQATVNDAVAYVHIFLAELFGDGIMLQAAQIDLCVDLVGFAPSDDWLELFVTRAQGKNVIEESQKDRSFYSGRKLETITFSGHGKPVSCKLYNKTKEIQQRSKEKVWFYDRWKLPDKDMTVWRVEYSIEREGLREMELEDIYDVLRNIKRLWAYCTHEWLRLATPVADTNRSRWPTSPTWVEIQKAFDSYGDRMLDALGAIVRERTRNAKIDQLTAQIAGCSTTLAALLNEVDIPDDAGAPEIFSVVYEKVIERWEKLRLIPQDVVQEKKFIHHQKG